MIRRPALHFDREFTIMPNAWVRDPRTSLATKGLLAQLLSHAPGWQVSVESLVTANPEGRHAIRTCIAQAREAGYLAVGQKRDQGGRFAEANYDLVDPFTQPEESAGRDAGLAGGGADHPSSENPTSVNRTHKKNIFQEEHLEETSPPTSSAGLTLDEVQAPTELDPSTPARSTAPAKALDAEFPKFWAAYPRKAAKGSALRAYRAARRKVSLDALLDALDTYQKNKPDWQDYAYPASWLNAERWEDQWTSAAPRNTPPQSRPVPNVDPNDVEAYIAAMTGGNR